MARKIIKKGVKAGVQKIGRGLRSGKAKIDPVKDLKAAKAATAAAKKTKTVKRSEAPIQSERSKITAANAAAKTRRAKAAAKTAAKTGGVGALAKTITSRTARARNKNKILPVGSKRAIATSAAAIAGVSQLNKKGSSAPAKVTFADAFRKARAKGEGTKFTHNGKSYTAVTKTDLKKKGFDANELAAYNKRGGKARGPLNRLGQKAKKVLLGKDKKFGGDKGAIDFIRKPKKKADGGMMGSPQAMPTMRRRPPTPPMPPRSRVPKTRTQLIDPKLPKGKVGKGPLEPSDSTTRVMMDPKKRMKFGERIRKDLKSRRNDKGSIPAMSMPTPPPLKKGPGMKDGGVAKKMGGGMAAKKYKGGGMATRGLGKAFKNSKR